MNAFGSSTPVAHKAHTCSYCGGRIEKGQTYSRWATADMGTVVTGKGHLTCEKAWWASECSRYDEELPMWSDFRDSVLGPFVEALTTAFLPRMREWVYG